MGLGDIVNEFENLVKEHPAEARGALDKAEEFVDEKTGGQYTDQIKSGGGAAESYLGISEQADAGQQADASQTDAQQGGSN